MRNRYFLKKHLVSPLLAVTLVLSAFAFGGCGEQDDGRDEDIVLIEPTGEVQNKVHPEYRSLYTYVTSAGVVCPEVTEISYEVGVNFGSYAKMPGEEIKDGDALINGDTTSIDEQIKAQREKLSDMAKDHEETVKEIKEQLAKDRKDYEFKLSVYEDLRDNPVSGSGIDYTNWLTQYNLYDSSHRYAQLTYESTALRLKQTEELYDLDYKYNQSVLKDYLNQRAEKVLYSDVDGTVVAINQYKLGDYIRKDRPVVAVGDLGVKVIKTKFVSRGDINTAIEYYAVINGKRYKVEYQALTSEEYKTIYDRDGVVYSTFSIEDPDDEVEFGALGTIVIIKDCRKDVLCVPKASVASDEGGQFVYVLDGDQYVNRYITAGMSDALYTEILAGVTQDDVIKAEVKLPAGLKTGTVNKGTVKTSFTENGTVFYPESDNVTNPVQYGVTYIDEICVSANTRVEKGQELLKIHVVPDEIEIARQERLLQRENARLQDLIKEDEEKNEKAIKAKRETIADLQKYINDMRSDAKITTIVADRDGIVTELVKAEAGDLISYKAFVARISDESSCFIRVEDQGAKLAYGNTVYVGYSDNDGNTIAAPGTVVSVSATALTRGFQGMGALIKVSPEDMEMLSQIDAQVSSMGWWSQATFGVSAEIRKVENVLVVPRTAVTDKNGCTYVFVKDKDGTIRQVAFVAGGFDSTVYWVAEGLEEGMTICLE